MYRIIITRTLWYCTDNYVEKPGQLAASHWANNVAKGSINPNLLYE